MSPMAELFSLFDLVEVLGSSIDPSNPTTRDSQLVVHSDSSYSPQSIARLRLMASRHMAEGIVLSY
jgi:hypothetical protein